MVREVTKESADKHGVHGVQYVPIRGMKPGEKAPAVVFTLCTEVLPTAIIRYKELDFVGENVYVGRCRKLPRSTVATDASFDRSDASSLRIHVFT